MLPVKKNHKSTREKLRKIYKCIYVYSVTLSKMLQNSCVHS